MLVKGATDVFVGVGPLRNATVVTHDQAFGRCGACGHSWHCKFDIKVVYMSKFKPVLLKKVRGQTNTWKFFAETVAHRYYISRMVIDQ